MSFLRFDQPGWLWLLLLAIPIVWLGMRSLAQLEPYRRWTAIGLRLAVLVVLVLMLAGLQAWQTHSDLTVIAVVDQSESVRRFAQPPAAPDATEPTTIERWVASYLRRASEGKRQDDRLGVVTYDGRPTVRAMPSEAVNLDPGTIEQPIEGTDTAAGLRAAMALFPPDTGARLVLVSDGNDTASGGAELIAAARDAAAAGVPVDVLPVNYRVQDEVMVEGLYAPTEAREGQTVALRAVLRATGPSEGLVQLLHDDVPVDLNGPRPGTGTPVSRGDWTVEAVGEGEVNPAGRYVAVKQIDLPMAYSGASKFVAVFEPEEGAAGEAVGDTMAVNNRAEAFTLVHGKGRILVVDNVGGESGMILPNALASRGIELDVTPAAGLPTSLSQLQRYDAVVLQNVPADLVTGPQQRNLATYVNNLGGGLVMVGGPDSFGAGGWTNSPIDQILPVDCEIPSQTILPSGALVLVIDRSGSMSSSVGGTLQTQQELANEAAALAVQTLYPQDIVGVVVFDHAAQVVVPLQLNENPAAVMKTIRSVQPEGGTNVYSGLELAYEELAQINTADAAIKHVVLLTDGQSTEPEPGGYVKLVGKMMKANITLSTVGVGDGHDGMLLNQLAQMGGGTYHPVTNPSLLPQVFIKEAKTIRKNLIKEQPFQPQLIETGSPVMNGINGVPELRGLVLTGPKEDPRVFMPMVGAEGEPVFAHWQVGLGRTAAFTSDATNRWATPWLQWSGYADFWARTARLIARPSSSRDIDLVTTVQGDRLVVRLDAAAMAEAGGRGPRGGASFGNFLRVRGSVLRPDGSADPIELSQTGPGIYEASATADATGNYIVSLFVDDPSGRGERRAVFGGASRAPGEELRRFESNLPLLQQIAEITGGRMLDPAAPQPASLFTRELAFESRSVRPLWRTLLVVLLVLILLDVASRRIAWDPVAIVAWGRAKVRGLRERATTRDVQAESTMAALKNRRAATQEKLTPGTATSATPTAATLTPAPPPEPAPERTRKFEAAPTFAASDSFADAVGGAKEDGDTRRIAVVVKQQNEAKDDGPTTSRLLAAKRRAQERISENE